MKTKSIVLTGVMVLCTTPGFAQSTHGNWPAVSIWTNHDDVVQRGQRIRVFFETDQDAYVTVFRIDTDGRLTVLFPSGPWDHAYARGDRRYEVKRFSGRYAFAADDYPGEGYVFAAASDYPFEYGSLVAGNGWHYDNVGYDGRVVGDPYVAVMDVIDQISPRGAPYPAYDVVPYSVGRRVDYPRFVCYDCHEYVRYSAWNPYRDPCAAFRLVIYDDPAYYPARIRDGTRVVFARSDRLEPRFVFQQRIAPAPPVEVRRERPVNGTARRPAPERRAGSASAGGVGRVPAPRGRGGNNNPAPPPGVRESGPQAGTAIRSPYATPRRAPDPAVRQAPGQNIRMPVRATAGSQRAIDPRVGPRRATAPRPAATDTTRSRTTPPATPRRRRPPG